jgi:replicative DNA helicase
MTATQEKIRVAPHSKESEMMVLGCMLTNVNGLNVAADALDDTDFYYTENKIVFHTLKSAYKEDRPADVHIISEELKRQEKLSAVGGIPYLTTLAHYAGTSAHIEEYCRIVKEKALLRRMIGAAQSIEKKALSEPPNVSEVLDEAQGLFYQISQSTNSKAGVLLKEVLTGVKSESKIPFLKELQQRQETFSTQDPDQPGITGVRTHYYDLDKTLNGFGNSNLMILAARPAMGKTAFALNVAENICFKENIPVGIFSLEMSADQLVNRLICSQAEVEGHKIQTGSLNGTEYQRIVEAVHRVQDHIMVIDDQPGLKITDLRARARRMKEAYGIGFLVIDYLQLLSGSGSFKAQESRQLEISEISRMLKNLARELNLPILCLSQLSRKVEERQGHRPMLSDLRESGCLAAETRIQDATTGKVFTIKELAERKVQEPITVFGVDHTYSIGKHTMVKAFYSGKKEVFELKTRSGRTIKASSNHPFLKLEGWTALEKLQMGDKIALPRKLEVKKDRQKLSSSELILHAHLTGDGCILKKQPYHYTSEDPDSIEIVAKTANELFKIEPKVVLQKNWYHVYLPSPEPLSRKTLHPITYWYEKLNIPRERSYNKKISDLVFECDLEQIKLFLHHLWATDGNISYKHLKGRKTSGNIYYSTSSKFLSHQVQSLLLRLEIQSTITTVKSKKGYRDMYHILIQGSQAQKRFLTHVGSYGARGSITPSLLANLETIDSSTNLDVIPKEVWQLAVREAKEQTGMSWRQVCKNLDMSYCGTSLYKNGISRERMQRLYSIFKHEKLKNLSESDIYWDEILSIESRGIEDVYDATVENVHNFVANDIIVHNSLEQDADQVLFLFRPEYYDKNNKPGLAELIVAKNRHGATADINLVFQQQIARFANYTPIQGF